MHLGFALCLRLGIFVFISLAGLTAALPPLFWDFVLNALETKERYTTRVYVRFAYVFRKYLKMYCEINNKFSRFAYSILSHFCLLPSTKYLDLQEYGLTERGAWLIAVDVKGRYVIISVWILIHLHAGNTSENMDAFCAALSHSPLFFLVPKIFPLFVISTIVNIGQSWAADYPVQRRKPGRISTLSNFVVKCALVIAMTSLVIHNGNPTLPEPIRFDYNVLKPILQLFRIDQVI